MHGAIGQLVVALLVAILIWLAIRSVVLWYFKISRIVELLEQIERNTRTVMKETVYYSENEVLVTSERVVIPPHEWKVTQLRPVKIEIINDEFTVKLLAKDGRQLHEVNTDNEDKVRLFAGAINKALGVSKEHTS